LSFVRSSRHFLSAVISSSNVLLLSGLPRLDRLVLTKSGFSRISLMSSILLTELVE
jgi:hypothetical protein